MSDTYRRNKKRKLAYKKEKKNKMLIIVVAVLVTVFCGFTGYKAFLLEKTKDALETDISTLENNIAQEQERTQELSEFEVYTHTKKYAEEVAKDVLGYVYEDEIVFKPEE